MTQFSHLTGVSDAEYRYIKEFVERDEEIPLRDVLRHWDDLLPPLLAALRPGDCILLREAREYARKIEADKRAGDWNGKPFPRLDEYRELLRTLPKPLVNLVLLCNLYYSQVGGGGRCPVCFHFLDPSCAYGC